MDVDGYIVEEFREKRGKIPPIPSNLSEYLNSNQLRQLANLEAKGWLLWFVRRIASPFRMPVLISPKNNDTLIINEAGMPILEHGYSFRPDAVL